MTDGFFAEHRGGVWLFHCRPSGQSALYGCRIALFLCSFLHPRRRKKPWNTRIGMDLYPGNGKVTGKMDSATQLAYKKFERENGFNANGVASPEEQAVLYSEQAVAAE